MELKIVTMQIESIGAMPPPSSSTFQHYYYTYSLVFNRYMEVLSSIATWPGNLTVETEMYIPEYNTPSPGDPRQVSQIKEEKRDPFHFSMTMSHF